LDILRTMLRLIAWGLLGGLVLGVFSVVGDGLGVDSALHVLVAMANAAGPWFVTAFVVGAGQNERARGAAAAALALALAVVVYYAGIYVGGHQVADAVRGTLVWLGLAALVGPVLGAAGATWSSGSPSRAVAVSLLGGLLLAEVVYRWIQVEAWTGIDLARSDIQVGLVDVVAAALLPLVLLRGPERRGYLAAVPIAVGGAAAMFAVTIAIRAVMAG
jgi:hypothetical protein